MLVPIEVPTGRRVLELVPKLQAALDGTGPGLVPYAAGTPAPPHIARAGIALAVGTSGSTGTPKQVLLSAAALRHSAAAGQRRLYDGDPGTWLLTLPAHHIAGLNVLLRAAVAGREPVVMDVAERFTPEAFAGATATIGAGPAFVSLVPTQLHRLLADPAGIGIGALRRFTAVLVGGAATAPDVISTATAQGIAIVTSYGMSETGGGCVYDGRPLDGVTAGIVNGRIVLSGPVVADGYASPTDRHAQTDGYASPTDAGAGSTTDASPTHDTPFGTDPVTGTRSFTTNDLGVVDPDGSLTVLGRADDILITGGMNIAPLAVEHALAGAPGVAELAITGVLDPEWGTAIVAVAVATPGATPDLATLRAIATATLGAAAAPRHLVLAESLPTRGPGKLDRAALARLAELRLGAQ